MFDERRKRTSERSEFGKPKFREMLRYLQKRFRSASGSYAEISPSTALIHCILFHGGIRQLFIVDMLHCSRRLLELLLSEAGELFSRSMRCFSHAAKACACPSFFQNTLTTGTKACRSNRYPAAEDANLPDGRQLLVCDWRSSSWAPADEYTIDGRCDETAPSQKLQVASGTTHTAALRRRTNTADGAQRC